MRAEDADRLARLDQQRLVFAEAAQRQEAQGKTAVLLVPGPLRTVLARFLRHTHRAMKVISYQEVPENRQITIEATVG